MEEDLFLPDNLISFEDRKLDGECSYRSDNTNLFRSLKIFEPV